MFGHWMEIKTPKVHVRMGPIRREEMPRFVSADVGFGLQSYMVGRYLGHDRATTEEAEYAWWDSVIADKTKVVWGIYVQMDGRWTVIGCTSLDLDGFDRNQACSGFAMVDRQYWRRGIAKTSHLARTLYAFEEMGMWAINSGADTANFGSVKALQSVGYVQTGMRYGGKMVHGKAHDAMTLLVVNPAPNMWNAFWNRPKAEIPPEFHEARKVTRAALQQAHQFVTFL